MQLMPSTAIALGVEDVFNPEQNIRGGVRYFKQLVNRFDGDVRLALAAYNAGSKNVIYYQGIPPFKSTHCYIEKVFKYYELYKDQMTEEMKKI
jgi:soluble lytic murein transglycosylase-like protein